MGVSVTSLAQGVPDRGGTGFNLDDGTIFGPALKAAKGDLSRRFLSDVNVTFFSLRGSNELGLAYPS